MLTRILARLRKPVEAPQTASDAARALSLVGHAKRRATVRDKARTMRRELGLPPHRGLA